MDPLPQHRLHADQGRLRLARGGPLAGDDRQGRTALREQRANGWAGEIHRHPALRLTGDERFPASRRPGDRRAWLVGAVHRAIHVRVPAKVAIAIWRDHPPAAAKPPLATGDASWRPRLVSQNRLVWDTRSG